MNQDESTTANYSNQVWWAPTKCLCCLFRATPLRVYFKGFPGRWLSKTVGIDYIMKESFLARVRQPLVVSTSLTPPLRAAIGCSSADLWPRLSDWLTTCPSSSNFGRGQGQSWTVIKEIVSHAKGGCACAKMQEFFHLATNSINLTRQTAAVRRMTLHAPEQHFLLM